MIQHECKDYSSDKGKCEVFRANTLNIEGSDMFGIIKIKKCKNGLNVVIIAN